MLTHGQQRTSMHVPLTHSVDGRGNPNYLGCKAAINAVFLCPSKINAGLFRFNDVMTGCCRQLSSWPFPRYGISTLLQSVTHSVERIVTALYSNLGHKPMLKNSPKQNPLTNPVSETKHKSLLAQVSIIRSAINIHGITQTQENFNTLKADALELVRMLEEIEQNNKRKTSLFNVLAKGTRRVIADRVTFDKALEYQEHNNTVIKFAGMGVSA